MNICKKNLGEFEMESGIARVSDPCYDKNTWCAGTIDKVDKGKWKSDAYISDEGEWGHRVSFLIAYHSDHSNISPYDSRWEKQNIDVGVDSGQAGIYDDKYFKDDSVFKDYKPSDRKYLEVICSDEPWYSWNCDVTLSNDAGVIPFGCASESGYGDGSYTCSVIKKNRKIIAIMIDYGLETEDKEVDKI